MSLPIESQAKELIDAIAQFAESMEGDNESTKDMKIKKVERYIDILNSMPKEEIKYLSKNPKKIFFDLEAYDRHNGTWEKLKMCRETFNSVFK